MTEPEPHETRDREWVDEHFPDAGDPPSNEVIVDEDAPPSPNIGHPK